MLARNVVMSVAPLARRAVAVNTPAASVLACRLAHDQPQPQQVPYKFPTMDELPVPCGSWQEHYDNNQRRYNIHLLLGVGFFLITLTVGIYSGALDLYLWAPAKPGQRPNQRN